MPEAEDIEFSCPRCNQSLEAPTDMAGETIECPACEQAIAIPVPAGTVAAKTGCPSCGEALAPGSVLCISCGFHTGTGQHISTELS
jgi:DNA-directed RNA polymerase subunit RPC12/RpoP